MKKRSKRRLVFNFFITFLGFFLMSGITTTISFLLFLDSVKLPYEHINRFAPYTFINLIFVSAIFGLIGTIWKSLSVEKPVTEINEALHRIKHGDLTSRLKRRNYNSRYSTIVNNINFMTNELASLDNLKVSLMSNISHELKTPVSVIYNYAALLQGDNISDDKRVEYAKAIQDSSKKMTELITNILKLNQLENQNIPTEMKNYDLYEQLCECLLNFENEWEEKSIEIETDIEENVFVHSDVQLMNIVWNNLFANALKFTPNGGKINVSMSKSKRYAKVIIEDTGCGIPEEQIDLIFEKFYQCDTSRGTDGNGLGLALVKRILNITDGFISVESTVGQGTIFTVNVPTSK